MKEKSLKSNLFFTFLKAFTSLVFPLITFPYASRILSPEGIGQVNFANSTIAIFSFISQLGIGTYATREAAKLKNDESALTKFAKEIITINIISGLFAYILFFTSLLVIPKYSDYKILLLICSVHIILKAVGLEWLYIAKEEFKYITIRSFIFQMISLVFLFVFVKTKEDVILYAVFGILTSSGSNIFNIINSRKIINYKLKFKLELKQHFKFILIFFGITIVTSLYEVLDSQMLGFLSTDVELGYYSASTKISKMTVGIITAVIAVFLPRLASYFKNGEIDKFNDLSRKGICYIFLLAAPIFAGILSLSDPFIKIFCGQQYLPAVPTMMIISPVVLAMSISSLTGGQILPAINKEKVALFSYIGAAILNITLNYFLIPKYGAFGAGIATLIAEFAVALVQLIFLRKLIFTKDFLICILEALAGSALLVLMNHYLLLVFSNFYLQLFVCIIASILLYALFLLIVRNKFFIELLKVGKSFVLRRKSNEANDA